MASNLLAMLKEVKDPPTRPERQAGLPEPRGARHSRGRFEETLERVARLELRCRWALTSAETVEEAGVSPVWGSVKGEHHSTWTWKGLQHHHHPLGLV